MSEDNSSRINRRTVLSTVGSTVATGALGIGLGAADSSSASKSKIDTILETEKVQTITEKFDGISIDEDSIETVKIKGDIYEYDVVRTPSTVGELTYIERSDGVTEATLLLSDGSDSSEDGIYWRSRQDLPEEYRDIPTNSTVSYVAGQGGDALFRAVTEKERTAIAEAVGANTDSIFAWTFDKAPGIQVIGGDNEDDEVISNSKYQIQPAGGSTVSPASGTTTPKAVTETLDPDQITNGKVNQVGKSGATTEGVTVAAQWSLSECVTTCGSCVATASLGCYRCYGFCASGVSGIGAVACAVCLVGSCSASAASCVLCADNCSHHVPYV